VGRLRLRRVIRARVGYFAGILLIAVGIYLALGLGWALVALGLGVAAAFVWLYDVSEAEPVVTRTDEGGWM
jgi:hypothetical protein